jgi:hypothetical protein
MRIREVDSQGVNDDTGKTAKGTNKAGQHVTLKCVTVTTEEWVATDKGLI